MVGLPSTNGGGGRLFPGPSEIEELGARVTPADPIGCWSAIKAGADWWRFEVETVVEAILEPVMLTWPDNGYGQWSAWWVMVGGDLPVTEREA